MTPIRRRWPVKGIQPVVDDRPGAFGGSGREARRRMDWADYLRDQAANYRKLAETAEDPLIKQELLELAATCEEVANNIEDRLPGG
jgi:hypothetical protein